MNIEFQYYLSDDDKQELLSFFEAETNYIIKSRVINNDRFEYVLRLYIETLPKYEIIENTIKYNITKHEKLNNNDEIHVVYIPTSQKYIDYEEMKPLYGKIFYIDSYDILFYRDINNTRYIYSLKKSIGRYDIILYKK